MIKLNEKLCGTVHSPKTSLCCTITRRENLIKILLDLIEIRIIFVLVAVFY